jgi:hypothetical protein
LPIDEDRAEHPMLSSATNGIDGALKMALR